MSDEQSESIAAIGAALAKAQGEIQAATKDTANPFFKSKYADLASCWAACREALSKNGIAVVQRASRTQTGGVRISTQLVHASGEWLYSALELPTAKADAQGIGSTITYGRRYGLCAMVGIAAEDDDGESAVGRTPPPTQEEPKPGNKKTSRTDALKSELKAKNGNGRDPALSRRGARLWSAAQHAGWDVVYFQSWCTAVLGVSKSAKEMGDADLSKLETAWSEMQEPPHATNGGAP